MGCASSAPLAREREQLSSSSRSIPRPRDSSPSPSSSSNSAANSSEATATKSSPLLSKVTPQPRTPPTSGARLSSPLSSLEEPGSSSTPGRRGRRLGRAFDGGGGNRAARGSSAASLLLARPPSAAALRVLEDDGVGGRARGDGDVSSPSSTTKTRLVTDDYVLGRVLGRGQFGTTRIATRRSTGEAFACKIILKRKLSTPSAVAAVRREIAIMRRLDHPSIVRLEGAYEDDRAVHLVVELCEGGELFESIARNGRFSERCASRRARAILETVSYLHSRGVVHRDLKPENFLLSTKDEEGPIKMIDFGLSAYANERERLSDVVGTAYYMAPEVLRGRYGHKADIWSVGVICYLMLSGSPPFRGSNERDVFSAIVHASPEFKGPAWRNVSSAAKESIAAMLAKDPRKRPNASELLRDCEWFAAIDEAERRRNGRRRSSLEARRSLEERRRRSLDERRRRSAAATARTTAAAATKTAGAAPAAALRPTAATTTASASAAAASRARAVAAFASVATTLRRATSTSTRAAAEIFAASPALSSSSDDEEEEHTAPLDPAARDSLRRFVGTDKLKRQATLLVAGRLRREQMDSLRRACAALDGSGEGVISVDQLKEAITCVATHREGDHGSSCAVVAAAAGKAAVADAAPKPTATSSPPSPAALSRACSSEACSLSSSMCDLAAAEAAAERNQRQQQLLRSRPASASSETSFVEVEHHHHKHHDCSTELGKLLRDVCEEFKQDCRLDYNKFVDFAMTSARVR